MTNFDKLVRWDADFYKSLPDEFCLYCLSKKQVYIIAQALPQINWIRTRWVGDTSGMDMDAIGGEIEGIFGMDNCGNLNDLIYQITQMRIDLDVLQNTVENGGVEPANETIETPYYQYTGQSENVGGITLACGTNADKDKVYGGVHEFVEYCCEAFTDFLQVVRAQGSAIPEKIDMMISAVPGFETLPLDEVFGLGAYIFEEVEEAWDALLTEDRKQEFKCKLFCAIVANDCKFTPELIISIIAHEAPAGWGEALQSGLRDALAIIIEGKPVGDEMFYSLIGTMLVIVLAGEQFLGLTGFRPFEYRFLAGYNSPDSDWMIFCDECAEIYWTQDYRFYGGDELGWSVNIGTWENVFYEGAEFDPDPDANSDNRLEIEINFTGDLPQIIGVGFLYDGTHECGITSMGASFWLNSVYQGAWGVSPTPTATLGKHTFGAAGILQAVEADRVVINLSSETCSGNPTYARIHGIRLWFAPDSPVKGFPQYVAPLGVSNNGVTDAQYWINF